MKTKKNTKILLLFLLMIGGTFALATILHTQDDRILSYTVDLTSKEQEVQLYWKDDKGEYLKSIQNLKTFVENKKSKLIFAMNAGMYKKDHSPQGLFIQQQKNLSALDTSSGNGNFYMKPNGVFYITTNNLPVICKTTDFVENNTIRCATQSGPMLVIEGEIHSAFKAGSANLNIRNGVGILPDKRIVFAMSKKEINFYDFASYFKKIGCRNALYLDGFVSRTYFPEENWIQTDGNFGVMIGVIAQKK